MYKIEKKDFGYKLTFDDFVEAEELEQWVKDSKNTLINSPDSFGVFVDMRTLKPLSPEAQVHMQEGQKLFKQSGMIRSVVILSSSLIKMQFMRIAKETGIYAYERYIDASSETNWEHIGIDWISKGIDPDTK